MTKTTLLMNFFFFSVSCIADAGKTWTVLYKPRELEAFSSQRSLSVAIIGTTQGRGKYNAACYVTFRK